MKKTIMLYLSFLLMTTIFAEEMVSVSYSTKDGAFIEELVPKGHWRTNLSKEDKAQVSNIKQESYEQEVFISVNEEQFIIGIDVLAFIRNERLRTIRNYRNGYLVQVEENGSVNGRPESTEPGFFSRQWNNTRETWEDNPWKIVAIGTGAFLLADYFIFDSGELNAWGLLGSTDSNETRNSSAADGRASESSNSIVVTGNNNQVNVTSNVDRGTTTQTDQSRTNLP